jgi:hypothetical protein
MKMRKLLTQRLLWIAIVTASIVVCSIDFWSTSRSRGTGGGGGVGTPSIGSVITTYDITTSASLFFVYTIDFRGISRAG